MQSALEREVAKFLSNLRYNIAGHDRGVLLGLFLCLAPIPPVFLFGFLLNCFNGYLLFNGRLARQERRFLLVGFLFAIFYIAVWFRIAALLWSDYFAGHWSFSELPDLLNSLIQQFFGGSTSSPTGIRNL